MEYKYKSDLSKKAIIFHFVQTKLASLVKKTTQATYLFNNRVVGQRSPLLVQFPKSPLVNQLFNTLQIGVAVTIHFVVTSGNFIHQTDGNKEN